MSEFKSGFISIVGEPNVGKSTLLNTLLGEKVAIVSNKPQTTRRRITGVLTEKHCQMVFVDTPGINTPKYKLDDYMQKSVIAAVNNADIIFFLVEPKKPRNDGIFIELNKKIKKNKKGGNEPKIFLIINKIDSINPTEVLPVIETYSALYPFAEIIPISALKKSNFENLIKATEKYLPLGPQYFPDDYYTDQTERQIIAELIREKALLCMSEEIPHGIAAEVAAFKERADKPLVDIDAEIYCEKKSHKGMIIGKNGLMLKRIGTLARKDAERFLGCAVNLNLWVKTKEKWRDQDSMLKELGFRYD